MTEKAVSLRDLIYWVKQELLSEEATQEDPAPLFMVDEVTVEVNFVVEGKLAGGFSALKIVEAGSEVSEGRVQKATVRLSPLLTREEAIDELVAARPEIVEIVKSRSVRAILKGRLPEDKKAPR